MAFSWDTVKELLIEKYKDEPDDYSLSIGHWRTCPVHGEPFKEFIAYLQITVGDLKGY